MNSNLTFREAITKEDYTMAWPLVKNLNPETEQALYFLQLEDMLASGNYTLYLAFEDKNLVGICGYWIATKFYCGKYLEVDNFIIDPKFQNKKYGSAFLDFIEKIALEHNCETLMLDAYLENESGHRFYERNGYKAKGYHFIKKVRI